MYFIRKALAKAETQYSEFEKITLALQTMAQKLQLYFQAHTISVLSTYPIQAILHNLGVAGRLLKWVMELSETNRAPLSKVKY